MPMTKKQQKALDRAVETIVQTHCSGIAINILDIPKVFDAAYAAYESGSTDIEGVVISTYRSLAKGGA